MPKMDGPLWNIIYDQLVIDTSIDKSKKLRLICGIFVSRWTLTRISLISQIECKYSEHGGDVCCFLSINMLCVIMPIPLLGHSHYTPKMKKKVVLYILSLRNPDGKMDPTLFITFKFFEGDDKAPCLRVLAMG